MPSCHISSPAPPTEWEDVGQHRSHSGLSHPLLYPVWCDDVIFYSSRKACGTPVDPEGCNLHFFLLLWLHVCVVICVVICNRADSGCGKTSYLLALTGLYVGHIQVTGEPLSLSFSNLVCPQGRTPTTDPTQLSDGWASALFVLPTGPHLFCSTHQLIISGLLCGSLYGWQ